MLAHHIFIFNYLYHLCTIWISLHQRTCKCQISFGRLADSASDTFFFLNMYRLRIYVHTKLLHWYCIGTREFPKRKYFEIFSNFDYQTLDASTSVTSLITHTSSLLSVSLRACVCTNVQACTHMLLLMFVCECLGMHFCMLVCVCVPGFKNYAGFFKL